MTQRIYNRRPILSARRQARLNKQRRQERIARTIETVFCMCAFAFVASVWGFVAMAAGLV